MVSKNYGKLSQEELQRLQQTQEIQLHSTQGELDELRAKVQSGEYDTAALCEYLLSFQERRDSLIKSLRSIGETLESRISIS